MPPRERFLCPTNGGFLKWWYPTTMGFPTKNDHFGVFWGYHHLRNHPNHHRKSSKTKKKPASPGFLFSQGTKTYKPKTSPLNPTDKKNREKKKTPYSLPTRKKRWRSSGGFPVQGTHLPSKPKASTTKTASHAYLGRGASQDVTVGFQMLRKVLQFGRS